MMTMKITYDDNDDDDNDNDDIDDDDDDDDHNDSDNCWLQVYILYALIHSEIADLNQKLETAKVPIQFFVDNTIKV